MPTLYNIDNYTWVVIWQDTTGEQYTSYCYTEAEAKELISALV